MAEGQQLAAGGGERRAWDVADYGGIDHHSMQMLQNLKGLRQEIGAQEDQASLVNHLKEKLFGALSSVKDEVAVLRSDIKRTRARCKMLDQEIKSKQYTFLTTANDMRQATDDLGAMEKYIAELGEKCQATWSQLDEATDDHARLERLYEHKLQQMRSFYQRCHAAKRLNEVETQLRYISGNPQHEPLMNELANLERHCDSSTKGAAEANAAAEALLARLSPAARARSEELLLSDTPDQQLEAAVVQLTVLGACAGGRGRTAGAGGSAAQ